MYSSIKWDDIGTLPYWAIERIKGINNVMGLGEFLEPDMNLINVISKWHFKIVVSKISRYQKEWDSGAWGWGRRSERHSQASSSPFPPLLSSPSFSIPPFQFLAMAENSRIDLEAIYCTWEMLEAGRDSFQVEGNQMSNFIFPWRNYWCSSLFHIPDTLRPGLSHSPTCLSQRQVTICASNGAWL